MHEVETLSPSNLKEHQGELTRNSAVPQGCNDICATHVHVSPDFPTSKPGAHSETK